MRVPFKPEALIRRQAAAWFVRLDADPSPETLARFRRWREADPRHANALRKAEAVVRHSGLLRDSELVAHRPLMNADARKPPASLALVASIAAALVLVPAAYVTMRSATPGPEVIQAVMLSSKVGEIRKVPLADGSMVTLDTQTMVRIEIARDRRQAILERGRARFAIARGGVPFTLRSGEAAVSLDEGIADISRLPGGRVDLISGMARIPAPNAEKTASVLQAPAIVAEDGARQGRDSAGDGLDWTSGRLTFSGARLADVALAANRYSKRQILVGNPAIQGLRVTGTFKTGNATALAASLAAAFGLRAEIDGSGNVRLERPPAR